jgi:small-conductance mechanosensitive channel
MPETTNREITDGVVNPAYDRFAQLQATAPTASEIIAHKVANDRSWVTRGVVGIFICSIAAVFVLAVFRGVDPIVTMVIEFLKSYLLPVVTLILGFYFGQASKNGA